MSTSRTLCPAARSCCSWAAWPCCGGRWKAAAAHSAGVPWTEPEGSASWCSWPIAAHLFVWALGRALLTRATGRCAGLALSKCSCLSAQGQRQAVLQKPCRRVLQPELPMCPRLRSRRAPCRRMPSSGPLASTGVWPCQRPAASVPRPSGRRCCTISVSPAAWSSSVPASKLTARTLLQDA